LRWGRSTCIVAPGSFQEGEKQRVTIARALAAKPEVTICDEITSALDQVIQHEILDLLNRLQQELKISYIFITHDLASVKAVSDEIVVMQQGEVVEAGGKAQILNRPASQYTQLLLASVPELNPDWLTDLLKQRVRPDLMTKVNVA